MPLLQRLVTASVDRPWSALAILALTAIVLAWPMATVPTDNSLAVWFVEDDPALARYHEFLDTFGNDEAVVIAYRTGGTGPLGLDEEAVSLQERAAAGLAEVDGVESVLSGAALVRAAGQESARPALERLGLAGPGDVAAIVARLEPSRDMDARRGRILDDVRGVLDGTLVAAGHDVRLAGTGVLYEGLNRQTERDGAVFLALAIVVMTIVLRLVLGSMAAVALTLVGPLAATAATTGIIGWTGGSLNVVMATLPALILVIGIADGVHILLAWYAARRDRDEERRALAAEVVGRMAVPCLFTSLTTALGFLALTSSRMAVIRELGIYAAVGMILVWAFVIVLVGAGLALFDIRPPARGSGAWLAPRLGRLAGRLQARRGAVLVAFGVAAIGLGLGASRVVVDTHTLGLLPDDHPVVTDSDWIETHLGDYTPLEFVIRAREGSVLEPTVLERVARWQDRAESVSGVERTLGLTDLFALTGDRVPGSAGAAEQAVGDLSEVLDDDLSAYLTGDRTATRVTAFVPMGTARDFAAAVSSLRDTGAEVLGDRASIAATGYLPLYVRIIDYTGSSTLLGLALAFAGVFVVLSLLLRSWRAVVAAIPPNLFAVLTVFGVMGWAGIPLDIATATVGAIILGIAVDDTVHFLHRYSEALRTPETSAGVRESADAVARALAGAGPAMILTSIVLVLGLGVLMAAGSVSIVYFGLLITLAVAAAVVADLILLPVLLPLIHTTARRP
jgi:uncharacterized protein